MPDLFPPFDGESLMQYLVRTRPQYNWQDNDGTSEPYALVPVQEGSPLPAYYVRPRLMSAEWAFLIQIQPPPPVIPPMPPVWPGAGQVGFLEPVALVDQLVVEGPFDGVLINVTTPPQHLGSYHVGGVTLDYGVGRIAFESDNGDLEPWQYLGFRQAIYTPRSMYRAARARLQVLGGAEGTVTPWFRMILD